MEKENLVRNTIYHLIEPRLKWKIGDLNLIQKVKIEDNILRLDINLVSDDYEAKQNFREQVFESLIQFGFSEIKLTIGRVNVATTGLSGVKHIIMVGSGKGGVGKSTISVNLAASLKKAGYKTGLMDADIYGPSVPILMGINEKPEVIADEMLNPIDAHGVKTISIGSLIPVEKAVAWRGQLVSGTILQFIRKVNWGELDFLIIDMPPGTGDIQLTMAKELKVDGVLVISMPQEVVMGDVLRSLDLYRQKSIPVMGVVQNMTSFACEKCGHIQQVFPKVKDRLEEIPQAGELILDPDLCDAGNKGVPYVLQNENTEVVKRFDAITGFIEQYLQRND